MPERVTQGRALKLARIAPVLVLAAMLCSGCSALGLVGGKLTTVGYFKVRVFPDAVTAITFRGVRPYQVK